MTANTSLLAKLLEQGVRGESFERMMMPNPGIPHASFLYHSPQHPQEARPGDWTKTDSKGSKAKLEAQTSALTLPVCLGELSPPALAVEGR